MPKIAEIDDTPNPNAVKFTLHEPLTWGISHSFENAEQAAGDALASALFEIAHVRNVFYVDRWLTVTQDGDAAWPELVRLIAVPLRAAPAAAARARRAWFPAPLPRRCRDRAAATGRSAANRAATIRVLQYPVAA